MTVSNKKLNFWADNKYNVIFCGRHGVGKTSIVESIFNERFGEQGQDWLYFSAATMDPWVDFIGVPKEKEDNDGTSYLQLVRPKVFAKDQVKAIFVDEFNRSPKKVRNAIMELMQFKSINGHKFNNLEIIWGAINPSEEDDFTYDVEEIDPAQLDRFHIYVDLPYTVSKRFFIKKYGEVAGTAACDWWVSLSQKHKDAISPRRLDYAINCWAAGGDIKDVLPKGISTSELQRQLKKGSYKKRINSLLKNSEITDEELADEIADESMFAAIQDKMMQEQNIFDRLFPLLEEEKMVKTISGFGPGQLSGRLFGLGPNDRVAEILGEATRRKNKFLTAAKVREIRKWKNYYHPSDDNDIQNQYEKEIYDIIGENSCANEDERTIETENTYYRDKRMEEIGKMFRNNKFNKALEENDVRLSVQYDFFEALASMCSRYQSFKFKEIVSIYFHKTNVTKINKFVDNLSKTEVYGDSVNIEIRNNPNLKKLLGRII